MENKGQKKDFTDETDFLYQTILEFVQLEPKDNIYQFIARKLKGFIKDSVIVVNSYEKNSNSLHLRALEGIDGKIKSISKILGKDIFKMPFPIDKKETKEVLSGGELLKVPGGLFELSFGQIPKSVCHALEKLLNVGEVYFSSFIKEKELFGNVIIILPKKGNLANREFINAFVKQCGIMLQAKEAESKLQDSEERLKILFDHAPDAYYLNDLKGNFVDGNIAAERMTGYEKKELIGKSFIELELLSFEDISKSTKTLAKNAMGQSTGPDEFTLIKKDKTSVIVEISTYPVKIKEQAFVLGIARDITKRKETEKDLIESEEKYRTVFENNCNATIIVEEDMTISMINAQGEKLSGYTKEKIENKMKWTNFVLERDLERMKKYHIARRKPGENPPTEYEFNLKDKYGNIKNIFMQIHLIPNTKKRIVSLADITRLKQSEEKMKHLNLVLRDIRAINQLIAREKNRKRLIEGACNALTRIRSYYSGWIVLLDEKGELDIYAESGLGKAFLPMVAQLRQGKLPCCIQQALGQKEIIVIEDPVFTCNDCLLEQRFLNRGIMAIRLKYGQKIYGVMSVSLPTNFIHSQEEQSLFKEVSEDICLALVNIELGKKLDKQTRTLKERVKELNYLFQISTLLEKPNIAWENLMQKAVDFFPSAFHHPEMACVQITLGTKKFKSKNFKETIWKLRQPIKMHHKTVGVIESYRLKEPGKTEKPFLIEEIRLIKATSESIGGYLERTDSKIRLEKSFQRLQKIMNSTIETMSKIIEAKDPYTAGHQRKVAQLATAIAKELKLSKNKIEAVNIASLIHDIGKVSIPSEILSKPTKLSDIEYALIKNHTQIGYDILKDIDFPYPIAQIVLQHHEKIDGSGYPQDLMEKVSYKRPKSSVWLMW